LYRTIISFLGFTVKFQQSTFGLDSMGLSEVLTENQTEKEVVLHKSALRKNLHLLVRREMDVRDPE
jgi:hypothetical protein